MRNTSKAKDDILLSRKQTRKDGVETVEGFIPHRVHPELGIKMPVLVLPVTAGDLVKYLPAPVRHPTSGTLVYAMPGGGAWYASL